MDKKPKRILLVEAQMRGMSRNKDGTVNYSLRSLHEVTNDEFALADQYHQRTGHLAFKLDEIKLEDIPEENTKIKGQISPSKRLRLKLFALHMKKGGTKDTFPEYYEKVIAGVESNVQEQIDQLED